MKTILLGAVLMLGGAWFSQYEANIDKLGIMTLGAGIGLIFGRLSVLLDEEKIV